MPPFTSARLPLPGDSITSLHFEDKIKVPNQLTLKYEIIMVGLILLRERFQSSFFRLVAEVRETCSCWPQEKHKLCVVSCLQGQVTRFYQQPMSLGDNPGSISACET